MCPTETLIAEKTGYRVQLGGKLGQHPQLAKEMPGIYAHETVLDIVQACIDLIKAKTNPFIDKDVPITTFLILKYQILKL